MSDKMIYQDLTIRPTNGKTNDGIVYESGEWPKWIEMGSLSRAEAEEALGLDE